MELEKFFTGYCRQIDQNRIVLAEYIDRNGVLHLQGTDCQYPSCMFVDECSLARRFLKADTANPD